MNSPGGHKSPSRAPSQITPPPKPRDASHLAGLEKQIIVLKELQRDDLLYVLTGIDLLWEVLAEHQERLERLEERGQ